MKLLVEFSERVGYWTVWAGGKKIGNLFLGWDGFNRILRHNIHPYVMHKLYQCDAFVERLSMIQKAYDVTYLMSGIRS